MSYFLKNYGELIFFTAPGSLDVPIDNNPQERLLRSPVIGRKNWYGTHSKLGAKTTSALFSVMESCKLNRVNPRDYLKAVVAEVHAGNPAFTPSQFKANWLPVKTESIDDLRLILYPNGTETLDTPRLRKIHRASLKLRERKLASGWMGSTVPDRFCTTTHPFRKSGR